MKESTHISPQTKKGLAFSSDYTPRTYGGYVLDQERYCHILERYCSIILNVNVCAKIWDKRFLTDYSGSKVKVNFALVQAMKTQRGSRGIALLFL
jgi:hypothetical protein